VKKDASLVAREYGFSSLQEIVRVILTKLAKREISIGIEQTPIYLSKNAEKRYLRMDRDFDRGKNVFIASSVEELMKNLNS